MGSPQIAPIWTSDKQDVAPIWTPDKQEEPKKQSFLDSLEEHTREFLKNHPIMQKIAQFGSDAASETANIAKSFLTTGASAPSKEDLMNAPDIDLRTALTPGAAVKGAISQMDPTGMSSVPIQAGENVARGNYGGAAADLAIPAGMMALGAKLGGKAHVAEAPIEASTSVAEHPISNQSITNQPIPKPNSEPTSLLEAQNLGQEQVPPKQAPTSLIDAQNQGEQDINQINPTQPAPVIKQEVTKSIDKAIDPNVYRKVYDLFGTSISSQFKDISPESFMLAERTRADANALAGQWSQKFDAATKGLNAQQIENFVSTLDGKTKPIDSFVKNAVDQAKALDAEVSESAIKSGMGYKTSEGKFVPFQPREDYWPHIFTSDALKDLKVKNFDQFKADMLAKGMSSDDIDKMLANSRNFGERLISPQNAREMDAPGYRTDVNAMHQHLSDMAHRITEAQNFGALDLADPTSPVSSAIKNSANPILVRDLWKKILNRDEPSNAALSDAVNKVTRAEAALHLSMTSLSHLNAPQFTLLQTNTKSFLSGLAGTLSDWKQATGVAQRSGALQNIFRQVLSEYAKNPETSGATISKVYGLDKTQNFLRTWAAGSARAFAEDAFEGLKNGTIKEGSREYAQLRNLVLEDPKDLIKQGKLTEQQLNRAGGRGAQITQGMADPLDLPPLWSGSPLANLVLQFHKYPFAQSATTWDAIKSNPMRSIPLLAVTGAASGEVTGDVKKLIIGAVSGFAKGDVEKGIEDELGSRGEGVKRLLNDYAQSWMLGIPADMISAGSSGGSRVLKLLAGPAIDDFMKMIDDVDALKPVQSGELTSPDQWNFNPMGRDAVSKMPFVGSGLSDAMKSEKPPFGNMTIPKPVIR